MSNKQKLNDSTEQKSEYEKVFDDAHKKLREMGDLGVVRKILVDEESTKPTIIPFPYGGKRYNDWVSS